MHEHGAFCDAVEALNWLHDGSSPGKGPTEPQNAAQRAALQHLAHEVRAFGKPPEDLAPAGALEELCGSLSYFEETSSSSTVVPLDLSLLSLPAEGHQPIDLGRLWGGLEGPKRVEAFCKGRILPSNQAHARLKEKGLGRPYSDPKLRSKGHYLQLLRVLVDRGMVDFSFEIFEEVGIFTVGKKTAN